MLAVLALVYPGVYDRDMLSIQYACVYAWIRAFSAHTRRRDVPRACKSVKSNQMNIYKHDDWRIWWTLTHLLNQSYTSPPPLIAAPLSSLPPTPRWPPKACRSRNADHQCRKNGRNGHAARDSFTTSGFDVDKRAYTHNAFCLIHGGQWRHSAYISHHAAMLEVYCRPLLQLCDVLHSRMLSNRC